MGVARVGCLNGRVSSRPSPCSSAAQYWPAGGATLTQNSRIFAVERLACMLVLFLLGPG